MRVQEFPVFGTLGFGCDGGVAEAFEISQTSGGKDSGPLSKPNDSAFARAVFCDVTHCLNKHTVLNDYCFCQLLLRQCSQLVPCYEHGICTTI